MACQPEFSQRASELQLTFYAIWLIFQIQNQQNFFQSDEIILSFTFASICSMK